MDRTELASVQFDLDWESETACHRDRLLLAKVDFWRDSFPGSLDEALRRDGAATQTFAAGELVPPHEAREVREIPHWAFAREFRGLAMLPRVGRFYPRGLLAAAGEFPQDMRPFRLLARNGRLTVDLNHPLARLPLTLSAQVVATLPGREQRGGSSNDIAEAVTARGPGMQAPLPQGAEFFDEYPFARDDEADDALFYRAPRLVHHLDSACIAGITALYARLLEPGMRVLDLMSSWVSHLPELEDLQATAVGMNREELERNPRLATRVVHDLNRAPRLPFDDASFDAVVCTSSVEYLTRPLEVFAEVRRVLRPRGVFACTFSERWFPPKVVRIWTTLHPFERLGLVLECLRRSGFRSLNSETVRGLPRPADDKYASVSAHSDPLYAAWGRTPG